MEDKEELDVMRKKLEKIRVKLKDGKRELMEGSEEFVEYISERFDLLKDQFEYFVVASNSIMHPDEFIRAISEIEGGKQLIFDNIDFIRKNSFKKDRLLGELYGIKGIENVLSEDFENRFNLAVFGNTDLEERRKEDDKFINSKYSLCTEDEKFRAIHYLETTIKSPNSVDLFAKNIDTFINPRLNSAIPRIVELLSHRPEFSNLIIQNFDKIKKSAVEGDLMRIYELIKDVYPEEYEKHKFTIEKIYRPAMQQLETQKDSMHKDDYTGISAQITNTCSRITAQDRTKEIKAILELAANGEEPTVKSAGSYSIIMKAGDKIFKFGGDRAFDSQFEIQNHPRILRPIIRKKDVSSREEYPLYIEVQDEVDVTTEITDEELLTVYKELREAGIKWCDVKKNNLGRLKKDNYGYPVGQGVPANNASLGLLGEDDPKQKVLKAGDIVIIDLDLIYSADYPGAWLNPQAPDFIVEYEKDFKAKEAKKKSDAHKENKHEDDDYGEH